MRKIVFAIAASLLFTTSFAQAPTKTNKSKAERAADHFMFQVAANFWSGTPDSVSKYIKGFNRSANVYVMYDKQFKSSPKFSVAGGIGIGTSNIYFNKMEAQITSSSSKLPFIRTDTGNNFKKYKLTTAFAEIPLELRFTSDPNNPNKSIKGALGVKVGTLLNAHTKGKQLRNSAGNLLNNFATKDLSKAYFNTTRLTLTGRVGYGIYSLFGAYSFTNMFKDGVAADTKLLQIGITISGL
jgi:hypothetical protein